MITLAWPALEHIQVMALRLHLIIGLKALSLTGSSTLLWSSRNKLKPRISQKKRKNTSKCESWWLVSPVTSRALFLMCHHWMSGKKQKSTHLLEGTALLILSFWSTLSLIFAKPPALSLYHQRLQGITKSISRYPTSKRRFDVLVKSLLSELERTMGGSAPVNGSQALRLRGGIARMLSQKSVGKTANIMDEDPEAQVARKALTPW